MSSIAYVTDEEMIEYYRLCGMRTMNFWRLSSRKEFKDFNHGDLLFFYSKSIYSKQKGFVGYAHYASEENLSLKQMWQKYQTENGYDSYQKLKEAIQGAAKDGKVPKKMNCLYLVDAVFFNGPVYPEEVGLYISQNLESYMYLDQENTQITLRILHQAEQNGVDLWSSSQTFEPENIFRQDEIKHHLANAQKQIAKCLLSKNEFIKAQKLIFQQLKKDGWEKIRNSMTDCVKIKQDKILIAIPFVSQQKNRSQRIQEYIGKIMLYKLLLKKSGVSTLKFIFLVLYEEAPKDLIGLVEEINNEK